MRKEGASRTDYTIYGLLIISVIIYSVVWSKISVDKYYAIHSAVFDLGVFKETNWMILHTQWTPQLIAWSLVFQGIKFITFPLVTFASYPELLIMQSFLLGLTALPMFGIANHFLRNKVPSFLISTAFLLYFPLSGTNWFDMHFQMFFVPLFLLGYYLYVKEKYLSSLILLILSGMVRYPYEIFSLIFGVVCLSQIMFSKNDHHYQY